MKEAYSIQLGQSSFVVRNGFVIITEFSGSKYMKEVKVELGEFLKASRKINLKECE